MICDERWNWFFMRCATYDEWSKTANCVHRVSGDTPPLWFHRVQTVCHLISTHNWSWNRRCTIDPWYNPLRLFTQKPSLIRVMRSRVFPVSVASDWMTTIVVDLVRLAIRVMDELVYAITATLILAIVVNLPNPSNRKWSLIIQNCSLSKNTDLIYYCICR